MRSERRGGPSDWIVPMAALSVAILLATEFVASPRVVAGHSMEPALYEGDRVLVDRWTYRQRPPRVGEIALLDGPDGSPMVKRIAPGPGGQAGAGIWVLGDNPTASTDSRRFGPVPAGRFHGRVVWRYWPLSRSGPIR